MDINNNESSVTPKLRDHEILGPFMEYIQPTCITIKEDETLVVYRTQNQVPVDEYGQSPRPRRKFGKNALSQKMTKEEVESLSPRQRDKIIGNWGLSCNDSEESARRSFLFTYGKLAKQGASEQELEYFAKERGTNICRYILTNEVGMITPFDENGHANLYLYEGVNLEDFRDKDYDYVTIDYQK